VAGDYFLTKWIGVAGGVSLANGTLAELTAAEEAADRDAVYYLCVFVGCSLLHVCCLVSSSMLWAYPYAPAPTRHTRVAWR
jgi:hypothetical protein